MTNNRLCCLCCIVLSILVRPLAAQEPPTPKQLIDAGHRVSDLGSLGPYILTANVTVDSGDKKARKTGRLTIAHDRGRTREELELGGSREVRIVLGGKQFIVAQQGLLSALELREFDRKWDPGCFIASKFKEVRRDKVEGADAWCMGSASGQQKSLSCFDAARGVYLGSVPSEKMSSRFFDYTPVGNQLFYPRRAVILRDDVERIEVDSIEVTPGAAKDDLFTPPENAIEIETCRNQFSPPKILYAPEPEFPELERKRKIQGVASMSVIIDKEGNVAAVGVVSAPTEGLARQAEATVRKWRFQPAMCGGRAVYQEIFTEVDFHLY